MPADYAVITVPRELPPTKTYTKPGARSYYLRAPGVLKYTTGGEPEAFCMADVTVKQVKGRKVDEEGYHVTEATELEVRNCPRDAFGRPAVSGYVFHCFTAEPSAERPGIYLVGCGVDGLPFWCGCLGARGHAQQSDCKHKSVVHDLATNPL